MAETDAGEELHSSDAKSSEGHLMRQRYYRLPSQVLDLHSQDLDAWRTDNLIYVVQGANGAKEVHQE